MKKLTALFFSGFLFVAAAQDGIYGSFMVGQKFVDFSELNTLLSDQLGVPADFFPNNNWTFGGEGHLILAKRLVLGGKAFGIMHERVLPVEGTEPQRRLRMTAGMGVGTVGLNVLKENRFGMHLYPQVGIGASSLVYQSKRQLPEERKQFNTVLVDTMDYIETLGKFGLIIDLALGFDWYKPFKNFFTIVPGLDVGLLLHAEAGYSLLPGSLKWRRDFDLKGKDQVEGGPDVRFNGFYFNIGVGIGLTAES